MLLKVINFLEKHFTLSINMKSQINFLSYNSKKSNIIIRDYNGLLIWSWSKYSITTDKEAAIKKFRLRLY